MKTRSAKQVWEAALGELQLQVTKANYETWLKDTSGADFQGDVFTISAPTTFATEWLEKRLQPLIKKTLSSILGHPLEVRFLVNGASIAEAPPPPDSLPEREAAPDNNHNIPRFNPNYTFATFIVGNCNRLAHAASLGVAEKPGQTYNPLFVYGGVGLGKTHLLHAIGHQAVGSGLKVIYVSSEQFTNEFINAIRERKNEEFRAKYRRVDVLLIDDIQFIAGKEQTQE